MTKATPKPASSTPKAAEARPEPILYRAQTPLGLGQTYPGHYPSTPVHTGHLLPTDFTDDPANVNTLQGLIGDGLIAIADGPDDRYSKPS